MRVCLIESPPLGVSVVEKVAAKSGLSMINSGRNAPNPRAGFTLLELAVALLIIGLLASLVAPRFAQTMTANRADMAAKRLIADLRRVQDTARITSSSLVVRFTVSPTASLYEAP